GAPPPRLPGAARRAPACSLRDRWGVLWSSPALRRHGVGGRRPAGGGGRIRAPHELRRLPRRQPAAVRSPDPAGHVVELRPWGRALAPRLRLPCAQRLAAALAGRTPGVARLAP